MTTPANEPPRSQRITRENPPKFPCWLWHAYKGLTPYWSHYSERPLKEGVPLSQCLITHYHPDQPLAPTERPGETAEELEDMRRKDQSDRMRGFSVDAAPHSTKGGEQLPAHSDDNNVSPTLKAQIRRLGACIPCNTGGTFENDPPDAIIDAAIRVLKP